MRILVEICNRLWLYLAGVSDYACMSMLLLRALEASWYLLLETRSPLNLLIFSCNFCWDEFRSQ